MIIAIPSVTKYISDSRKSAYINTAKQVINATKNLVNSGNLGMYDTNTAYYIPNDCIKIENGNVAKSPYGEFEKAYVAVTYDGKGYTYYWTSVDESGIGIKVITKLDALSEDDIESNLSVDDIREGTFIESKNNALVLDSDTCSIFTEYNDSPEPIDTLYNLSETAFNSNKAYIKKYEGEHIDAPSGNGNKDIYYFYNAGEYNNVIFAGICWQILRTTDDGGIKMIYFGEPTSDGKCTTGRPKHVGYGNNKALTLSNTNYAYGTDYTYDESSKTFTLSGSITNMSWDSNNWGAFDKKYTCKSESSNEACSELYYLNTLYDSTRAYAFQIDSNQHYAQIGTMQFNMHNDTLSELGYMYNYSYKKAGSSITSSNNYMFSNNIEYRDGKYYLIDSVGTQDMSNIEEGINNAHYTCLKKGVSECEKVYYVYGSYSGSSYYYYIELSNNETVDTALNKMLYSSDVNKYDSIMKQAIELWFERNLKNYLNYIDDVVYCNDRTIYKYGGWATDGKISEYISFSTDNFYNTDLYCNHSTDRFSVSNSSAKLKYPVGLINHTELRLITLSNNSLNVGTSYWSMSPYYSSDAYGYVNRIRVLRNYQLGEGTNSDTNIGVRPVITLKPNAGYISGTGKRDDPYIVNFGLKKQ